MKQKRFRKLLMSYRGVDRNLARDVTAGYVFRLDKEKGILTRVCTISYEEALKRFKDAGLLCRG